MRLHISAASPFARKARVVLREKGLAGQAEELTADFPYKDAAYTRINPLGQVPALETDDGQVLFNSPVICAYLDCIGSGPRLLPPEDQDHWRVRRLETLGDGAMEMTVKQVLESRRPENLRSAEWIGHWRSGLALALDQAEAAAPEPGEVNLGSISLAVACTYAGFRLPDLDWAKGRPRLAALTEALERHLSFQETYPN
ncbi:MAG TPA: glutathione S-transferase N-terminal domain-containing protein [Caulobacteraceae bacterium]|jgi:glutathione S-transferase